MGVNAQQRRERLNAIMTMRRVTAVDLAGPLGVKPQTVRCYRAGVRDIPDEAMRIIDAWYSGQPLAHPVKK